MKVLKPENLAFFPSVFAHAGELHLVLSLFACFSLASSHQALAFQEDLTLLSEAELWSAVPQVLGEEELFDAGRLKPRAEFLVYGDCVPPQAVEGCPVMARVGSVTKRLMVFGDRGYGMTGPDAPRPFSRLPLTWENTFGGRGFPDNPQGKGLDAQPGGKASGAIAVPNVILEAEHPLTPGRRPRPACPRAVPQWWSSRTQYLGPLGRNWMLDDFPELPASTNPLLHMSAQPDQWLEGYLSGGEDYELTNMHPSRPRMVGKLPSLRPRVFVTGPGESLETFREVQTVADTVWFFPGLELGVLCFRAQVPIHEEQAEDISNVVLGMERQEAPALPLAVYLEQLHLELFLPEEGGESTMEVQEEGGSSLSQPVSPELSKTEVPNDTVELPGASPEDARPEPTSLDAQGDRGSLSADGPTVSGGAEELGRAQAQAELESQVADAQARCQEILENLGCSQEQAQQLLQDYESRERAAAASVPKKSVDQLLAEAEIRAEEFQARHGLTPEQYLGALNKPASPPSMSELEALATDTRIPAELAASIREAITALAALRNMTLKSDGGSESPDILEQPTQAAGQSEPSSAHTGMDHWSREHDLTGVDFSGQNLTGRDFSGAMLERAVFDHADLSGAVFTGAVLHQASFRESSCAHAVLRHVVAAHSDFQGTDLTGADLTAGDFTGADFYKAILTQATCIHAVFEAARMTGARAFGLVAVKADFSRADLAGADLGAADLTEAILDETQLISANMIAAIAVNARLDGALLQDAELERADLRLSRADAATSMERASLRQVRAEGAQWSGANLSRADLTEAHLDKAGLARCNLSKTVLRYALAREVDLGKALLEGADLRQMNLMNALLRHADLRGARLDGANCFGADLYKAMLGGARLERSNLKRTLLDPERFRDVF
ncbi:DUF2169 domain-containing protein [Desulfonatronum thioautotrophicum]|uniref:DUF2169 domain-containing protein n=1 Tax=Desulfonatronum thioautotrophicum TaxID=617001 RepID=UPI0005EBCCCF|nr:DUF2169 domain-containing protein [Desulfonatronum thioautotrophicum]